MKKYIIKCFILFLLIYIKIITIKANIEFIIKLLILDKRNIKDKDKKREGFLLENINNNNKILYINKLWDKQVVFNNLSFYCVKLYIVANLGIKYIKCNQCSLIKI